MFKKVLTFKGYIVSFLSFFGYFLHFGKSIANPLTDLIIALSICTGILCCGGACLKLNTSCCDCNFGYLSHSPSRSGYSALYHKEDDELTKNSLSPRPLSRGSIKDEPV
ncbi:MAG: hypothetical protein JSS34_07500 [Proteobacteria bacterium]|nr:hypothetical protein [Pseudomonadota bacterium]